MNIHVRACVLDGDASINDVLVKVKTSLHQAFPQVIDGMNLCFIHALMDNSSNK